MSKRGPRTGISSQTGITTATEGTTIKILTTTQTSPNAQRVQQTGISGHIVTHVGVTIPARPIPTLIRDIKEKQLPQITWVAVIMGSLKDTTQQTIPLPQYQLNPFYVELKTGLQHVEPNLQTTRSYLHFHHPYTSKHQRIGTITGRHFTHGEQQLTLGCSSDRATPEQPIHKSLQQCWIVDAVNMF